MTTTPVPSITDDQLAAIEALALEATPGPWGRAGTDVAPTRNDQGTIYVELWKRVAEALSPADAEFIATANPATILAMIERIRELEKLADKSAIIDRCMEQLKCDEREGGIWTTCTLLLIGSASKLNSGRSEVTHEGVTIEGNDIGDWRVIVEKIPDNKPSKS